MPYHSVRLTNEMLLSRQRVELCHDRAKTMCWLQLSNTDYITNSNGPGFVKVLIGAVYSGGQWVAINANTVTRFGQVAIPFGDRIGDRVAEFQRAIVREWANFTSGTARNFAKGLTVGQDMSSPSFVMKAIKTGFDAIGVAIPAYDGMRMKHFTVDDAIGYLQQRANVVPPPLVDPALGDFDEIGPDPRLKATEDAPLTTARGDMRIIKANLSKAHATHSGRFAYAAETARIPFPRLVAYAYRGDSRPPSGIKTAGGFNPNYTRPDQIAAAPAKNKAMNEALDLQIFLGAQFLGGFVSTSKSYAMAKGFATGLNGTTAKGDGWVYACFVEGGFEIPRRGKVPATATHPEITVPFDEQELAMPGLLDWADVVACRRVLASGQFDGNIFIKRAFMREDSGACNRVYAMLSGESQG